MRVHVGSHALISPPCLTLKHDVPGLALYLFTRIYVGGATRIGGGGGLV